MDPFSYVSVFEAHNHVFAALWPKLAETMLVIDFRNDFDEPNVIFGAVECAGPYPREEDLRKKPLIKMISREYLMELAEIEAQHA